MPSRREILKTGLTTITTGAISISAAGCLGDGNNDDEDVTISVPPPETPQPTIESVSAPRPSVIETNRLQDEYEVTFKNEGDSGPVTVEFYWRTDADDGGDGEKTKATQTVVDSPAGVTKTVRVEPDRDSAPPGTVGYWFTTAPETVTVSVSNGGERGDIAILINTDRGAEVARREVTIGGDETKTVEFSGAAIPANEKWVVELELVGT